MMRLHVPVGGIIAAALFPVAGSRPDLEAFVWEGHCSAPVREVRHVPSAWRGRADVAQDHDEVRPWARAIKSKVVSRQMPPWYAEGDHRIWRNDRRLSQADIDKIVAWVDAGAPRGNDSDVPPLPQFAQGWNHPSGGHPM